MNPRSLADIAKPLWSTVPGPDLDVVISARCRIARNLAGYPFPARASPGTAQTVLRECGSAIANAFPGSAGYEREELDDEMISELLAARYISERWRTGVRPASVHVMTDGGGSIMVNEEDHIRIQSIASGNAAEETLRRAKGMEARLASRLVFARSPRVGALTSSLSNAGTGLRLGFLLHLPALAASEGCTEALRAASELGCAVRGVFGEGSGGTGALMQVSNRCTYGRYAAHSADGTVAAARYLADREREARGNLLAQRRGLEDLTAATEGARALLLTEGLRAGEAIWALSTLRLGIAAGVIQGDLLRTGEWLSRAGAAAWALRGASSSLRRYEDLRTMAIIRADLRRET
ncbi:MAG: hypothetical protein HUU17_02090 [Chthonomonadales bacterium]|nr:hypothetical protein [Chthonomonadales bacterium]